jgi:hypothetical protein
MLVKYVLGDGISQTFLPFRFVEVIIITDHGLFWNVGQANGILKYFENMMIDHSDSTIFQKMADFAGEIHTSALHESQNGRLFYISTAALITNIPLTSWCNEMIFTEKIEKELI